MRNRFLTIGILVIGINFSIYSQMTKTDFNCINGTMNFIKIESSFDTEKIVLKNKRKEFYIEVDTTNKSKNFISYTESYFRSQSIELDTLSVGYVENWNDFNSKQKLQIIANKRKEFKKLADEVHLETNQGQQIVSLINQTRKDLWIPTIDGIPAIVLQAKNSIGEWKTIRFIYFNWCGNSYSYSEMPKKSKFDVLVELPRKGDFQTTLKFKMFYDDKFVYSNEFDYKISHCDFFENGQIGNECINCKATGYNKLEVNPTHW